MKKLLLAFFMIVLFSGCVPSEWQELGFTGQEEKGNTYEDWQRAGYSPYEAGFYRRHGISLKEVEKYHTLGVEKILKWKKITNNNFELVAKWINLTHSSSKALEIIEKTGIKNPKELIKYLKIIKKNLPKQDQKKSLWIIQFCVQNHITPNELQQWYKIGLKNEKKILELKKENISVQDFNKYIKKGIVYINLIEDAIKQKVEPDVISNYAKVGIKNLDKILLFKKLHIKPIIAKKYANLSKYYLSKKKIFKIIKNCPNGVRDYAFDMFNNARITNSVSELNPMATKGKCFNSIWKVSQILSPKEIIVREYSEYNKYSGVQFNGRQSMIIFKNLPDYITEGVVIGGIVKGIGYEKMSRTRGGDVYVDKFKPILIEKSNMR